VDSVAKRLACLIAGSAILHATVLVPLQVRMTPARQPFSPRLTVEFPPRVAPPPAAAQAVAPASAEPPVTRAAASEPPAPAPAKPAESTRFDPPLQPAGPPAAPTNDATPSAAPLPQGGVRLAALDEVRVRVYLLSYEGGHKPEDTLTIQGRHYTYFKSPSLRRALQPLDDIKPHYPTPKPNYVHGAVKLQLLINEAGELEQANVICSNPDFEKSALASVEHLRFTPAQTATGPVKSFMVVEFGYGRGYPCAPVPDLSPSK
jgi:hypothetical protein